MSGTNHHANFNKEFERRYKANNGKYDMCDFAYDLYREKLKIKKLHIDAINQHNKIEYGI